MIDVRTQKSHVMGRKSAKMLHNKYLCTSHFLESGFTADERIHLNKGGGCSKYLAMSEFVKEVDNFICSFSGGKHVDSGKILCCPFSDNNPHIGYWAKVRIGVQHFCSVMALDSKPEEMFDKVLAPVESQITAKEETEMIAKEKLEEMVKEENVIFLISDKQVRKEESRKKKIHVCPHKYCEQSFSRPCSLASHIRSHTSKCSHQCKVPGCEKAHFSSSHLRRHKATSHMSLPIFKTLLKCPHPSCMAQLSSSSSLKRHYWRIHKQQHLFTCSFCDKRFFRQSQWQAHLYEHTGVPPIIFSGFIMLAMETSEVGAALASLSTES